VGQAAAVFEFRGGGHNVTRLPTDLHPNGTERCLHRLVLAGQPGPPGGLPTNAEGGCLAEDDVFQTGHVSRVGQRREDQPRTRFLHLYRQAVRIECTRLEKTVEAVADGLARAVVQVGLQDHDLVRTRVADRASQYYPQQVGPMPAVACARPIADGLRRHRGQRAVPLRQCGQNRGPRRGEQLARRIAFGDRHALEQGRRAWRRDGHHAVLGTDDAAADDQRRADDLSHPKQIERGHRRHHVDNGVDRPDLMEVDLLNGHAVRDGLRLGQAGEDAFGLRADGLGQLARVQNGQHVLEVPMRLVAGLDVDAEASGGEVLLRDLRGLDTDPGHVQAIENLAQPVNRGARVNQGADDHVAGGAAEAVKVGDGHGAEPPRERPDALGPGPNRRRSVSSATVKGKKEPERANLRTDAAGRPN